MKKFKFPMRYVPITATILVFFIVYLIGIISFPNFGSLRVFLDLFTDNAYLGIAAIGTALVILTGGIDVSEIPISPSAQRLFSASEPSWHL